MQVRARARGSTTHVGEVLPGTLRVLGYPELCVHVYCPSFFLLFPSPPAQGLLSCPRLFSDSSKCPSVPRVTLGLSSAVSSGQTQRRAANCNFFFSSLFVSILFQLGVDFTLLAGKRRLPSPNFFKSNPFFFLFKEFCQGDATANPVQLCWPNPWIQICGITLLFTKACDAEGSRELAWLFNLYSHQSGFYLAQMANICHSGKKNSQEVFFLPCYLLKTGKPP